MRRIGCLLAVLALAGCAQDVTPRQAVAVDAASVAGTIALAVLTGGRVVLWGVLVPGGVHGTADPTQPPPWSEGR